MKPNLKFKNFVDLVAHFSDEATCVKHLENLRWNGKPVCPHCGAEKPYKTNRGYKCSSNHCYKKFTVKVGTFIENTKIPLSKWFIAIYLCFSHKKGISSLQLSRDLGITQKTAWFMLHRIRSFVPKNNPKKTENFWNTLNRAVYGTYHQISKKHTAKYINEFAYKHSTRQQTEQQRFDCALAQCKGRLLYKVLIAK